MKTQLMIAAIASVLLAGGASAFTPQSDLTTDTNLKSGSALSVDILARRGADDPAGDDRGGGKGGKGRGGADDPAGHA